MITGKSGSFDLSYGNFTARFTWVEEYDPNANTSVVKTNVAVKSSYWYDTYFLDGTISVDGKTVVEMSSYDGSHSVPVTSTGTFYNVVANGGYSAPPWSSQVITHNLDGTKTVSITVEIYGYTLDGSCGSGWHMSGSRTIELTHIPWASTIGATDTNIGGSSVIAVSRKSTA